MKCLDGKRVLLWMPRFFGYEREICSEIECRGATVDWIQDRPFDTPFMAAVTKLNPKWVLPTADKIYDQRLEQLSASRYDIILVINGQTLTGKMLRRLRTNFPMATVILYMWDSMENRPGIVANLPLFDTAYSFDPLSAAYYGLRLRPLFFSKGFECPPRQDFDYHLSFVGTIHSDRYAVISKLRQTLGPNISGYWYLYLQAPWVYYAYRLSKLSMRRALRSEFQFTSLDKATVGSVFARSYAIVDVEHPLQRGLTMRTFETMGAHKKLVTTNAQIRDYDFFRSENIFVIDRDAPKVPAEFFERPLVPLPSTIYHRYSIAGWLEEVLAIQENIGELS